MFYVCIAGDELPLRVMYPEHFIEKIDADKRAKLLALECYIHDGTMWGLYQGEEPIESTIARGSAPKIDGETQEDCKIRLDALSLKAAKSSKSKLTAPEIDDVPEWFKQGFHNKAEMDLQTGKITQKEYENIVFPKAKEVEK